jgi:HEAT repeat protein
MHKYGEHRVYYRESEERGEIKMSTIIKFKRQNELILVFFLLTIIILFWEVSIAQEDIAIQLLQSSENDKKLQGALLIKEGPNENRIRKLLLETGNCRDIEIRKQLIQIISEIDATDYVPEFIEILGRWRNNDVRKAIKIALLRSSTPLIVDELVNLADSKVNDQRLVRDIARTLSDFRSPQVVPNLVAGINSQNISIAAGCTLSLSNIGAKEAVSGLIELYPQVNQERKLILLEGISRVRNSEALPILEEAVSRLNIDQNLRDTINQTIQVIGNSDLNIPLPKLR